MSAKRKRAYDATIKLQAVEVAEKSSKEGVARQFRVDPRRIREWCTQKEKLLELKKHGGSLCANAMCVKWSTRAREIFKCEKLINACLELAPLSNKRRVNRPTKKIYRRPGV